MALLLRQVPATSTSATSARTTGRRSTTRRARARASRTTAGTSTRARTRSRARSPNSAGHLVMPVAEYSHANGCSITGGYVWKGRYYYGDFCSGRVWSLRIAGGKATGVREESINVPSLSSWAARRPREPLAVSLDGKIYRVQLGCARAAPDVSGPRLPERRVGERLERLVRAARARARSARCPSFASRRRLIRATSAVSRSMRSSSASSCRSVDLSVLHRADSRRRAARRAPREQSEQQADGVDRDVDRRRRGVRGRTPGATRRSRRRARRAASAGASRPSARTSRKASTAYSVMCAHLRRTRSQVAEAGAEARDRREREDQRRPERRRAASA